MQGKQVSVKDQIKSTFIQNFSLKELEVITGSELGAKKFLSDFTLMAMESGSKDYVGLAKCAVEIAQMGLPIHKQAGQAYIVPRSGKLNIEIGYKGWLVLAKRAGYAIKALPIYKGDKWGYKMVGFDDVFEYEPSIENLGAEKTSDFIEQNLEFIAVCCKDLKTGIITNELIEMPLLKKLRSKAQSCD